MYCKFIQIKDTFQMFVIQIEITLFIENILFFNRKVTFIQSNLCGNVIWNADKRFHVEMFYNKINFQAFFKIFLTLNQVKCYRKVLIRGEINIVNHVDYTAD